MNILHMLYVQLIEKEAMILKKSREGQKKREGRNHIIIPERKEK